MESAETNPLQINRPKIGAEHEPMRQLFELIARYIVTGVGAYWIVVALGKIAINLLPALSLHPKGVMLGLLVSFLVLLAASNSLLSTGVGQSLRRTIAIYAYPIILVAGVWGGYRYCEYDFPRTEQGRQYQAALSACMEQPMCFRRMQEKAN